MPAAKKADRQSLYSYVVRYDSGFAPNPFGGYCTLATCKPGIRKSAQIGDWLLGTGSSNKKVNRGGHIVYAMRVEEAVETCDYWRDERFQMKKPVIPGSWKTACGDNIYQPLKDGSWHQLNSYHSRDDGSPKKPHIARDTAVQRILISQQFVYFGAEGPLLPSPFREGGAWDLLRSKRGYSRIQDTQIIDEFEFWFESLELTGFHGQPWDWLQYYK
ncbi:Nmad2 family putative nucleotide modification protein [Roseovarius aestuarii]|uniref:Nucleotide modification associated domain-containing protein n=1 Tax=Roseovarius aestuarii TaxID=475083 RepID=A0A1X7BQF5_9RHOB|nr:hypothetical protein [Roseovarius aestuarii]SMC11804.1 hypothetical protein ROA7745_01623 [Roseovarius aestuarii]